MEGPTLIIIIVILLIFFYQITIVAVARETEEQRALREIRRQQELINELLARTNANALLIEAQKAEGMIEKRTDKDDSLIILLENNNRIRDQLTKVLLHTWRIVNANYTVPLNRSRAQLYDIIRMQDKVIRDMGAELDKCNRRIKEMETYLH